MIKSSLLPVFFQDNQLRIRIQGGKRKGKLLQGDIIASNGILHIVDKSMDNIEPTFESNKEVRRMLYTYSVGLSFTTVLRSFNAKECD